ncbi:MAG: hypothetical protein MK193_03800 [Lentisphaeria bacterium]|nr:hypothetical protein [Lentisphaeria bacterium]
MNDRLQHIFEAFDTLNPDIAVQVQKPYLEICCDAQKEESAEIFIYIEKVLHDFLNSEVKVAEKAILSEFNYFVDQATKSLENEIKPIAYSTESSIVPNNFYSNSNWFRLLNRGSFPVTLLNAIEATQRRNEEISSIFETLFRGALKLNPDQANSILLNFLSEHEDADLIRDLIRAWEAEDHVSSVAIEQALTWSSDKALYRHWPTISKSSNRFLMKVALKKYFKQKDVRLQAEFSLQRQAPFHRTDRLVRWFRNTINQLGDNTKHYLLTVEKLLSTEDPIEKERLQNEAFRELNWLVEVFPLIILLSDLFLKQPEGTWHLAMATFGFSSDYLQEWRMILHQKCEDTIRRTFIFEHIKKKKPQETIHMLSFGDVDFERNVNAELDYVTKNFDSLNQRDKIVTMLAYNYASYREDSLRSHEIGRRYRNYMQMLHPDKLQQIFTQKQLEQIQQKDSLQDFTDLITASRKYLSIHRSLQKDIEDLAASDLEYMDDVQQIRTKYLRRLFTST